MTHHRILLILISLFLGGVVNLHAQHLKLGGKVDSSTEIDSLLFSPIEQSSQIDKDILARLSRQRGQLKLNISLDLTRLSHLKPVQTENFNSDYPQFLLRKRRQLQVRIGLTLFLKSRNKSR